ncbi:suppressor for copper-sensitivity B [Azospirillum fermentarium]|uniref:protein-disulfide reductase DsbD family protein n=1 Tax=Azospirillum fermentarium TaxID=1233114 RepID=UPI002227CCC6|nr:protein-disulfide reductase DsbD domain-containing protein [Azospirillum fermentarium]MCW2246836.1 suppressor for copper-sensitivity B [Azospirillum fermentarium]
MKLLETAVPAKRSIRTLLPALLLLIWGGTALAASSPWARDGAVEARLVSAVDGAGDLTTIPAALEVRLDRGWKTYWRSPGDAGLPPRLDWAGSVNLRGATLDYPTPHRITTLGIETVGYEGDVTFPIRLTPAAPGQPVGLSVAADLLVCSELCVPQRLVLRLDLPAGPATPGPEANDVARAVASVPGSGAAAGLELRSTGFDGTALVVTVAGREPMVSPDVFVETDPPLALKAPQRRFAEDDRLVTLRLDPAEGETLAGLTGRTVTLTVVDGERAMTVPATVAALAAPPSLSGGTAGAGLWAMLGVALLGGLILNLMPCVLPVLSLKLLSVVSHGGQDRARVRAGFLASAAGVIFSFLVLAAAMAGLKAAGAAVGWGIQFQEPLFLVFMVVLVTLFAANLWGLFEVPLPRFLADSATSSSGGAFATGAFATLLATPCSAPFLGTAVGFALAHGPMEIGLVFLALGVGMAAPYLLVAAVPGLARALPRPGRWMIGLRRILGAALALTGVWLLSVLSVSAGATAAGLVAVLMAAVVGALWLGRRIAAAPGWAGGTLAAALAAAAFAVPAQVGSGAGASPVRDEPSHAAVPWVPFDEAAIAAAVAGGRTVFVDVTADWCITCQANKKLVINRGTVAQRLGEAAAVIPMRADWTRPDERISRFLARYGRYGIPFNIVYGPAAPEGVVLPELLSESAVLAALEQAKTK